jgi:hypothetical protein
MRSVVVIGSMCLALTACSVGGEDWTVGIGKYTLIGPPDATPEQNAAQPPCDTLDGAMCARDGTLLCAGTLEGVNAPAMCPATGE